MKPVSGLQIFAVIFLLFALNACSQSQPEKSVAYSGSFRMHTANAFIGEMMQPNQTAPASRSNTNPDPNCMDKFTALPLSGNLIILTNMRLGKTELHAVKPENKR